MDVIATERLDCLKSSGERIPVVISIGRPSEGSPYWVCPVHFTGIYEGVHSIEGSDSFQALCLCLMFVQRVLTGFVQNGGRVLYAGSDADFPLQPYFQHNPI